MYIEVAFFSMYVFCFEINQDFYERFQIFKIS